MVRYLPFLISLGLSIYALFSCIQTPDEDVPHLPKLVWIILIVLVPFAGPIVWLLMSYSYRQRAVGNGSGRPARPSGPAPSTGPPRSSAPDDDPEFLAWLARQQRRKPPPKPAGPPQPPEPPKAQDKPKHDNGAAAGDTGAGGQNEDEARPHDE